MTTEFILLALALLALLAAVIIALWTHLRARRMLDTLDRMLDDAVRGDFQESLYDESRLSALETRMAHYLSSSAVSARNLAEEKDKIKTLIGDISHQTKTPIANLLLYAQLLGEQDLPPESRAYVSALEHQAEKLRFLIDALVKTSRLESGVLAMTPKSHPIQQLLEAAAAQAAPRAEARGIALTVEPADLTARFDPKWTTEALYNLVDNAVKYTPAGGSVTLRAVGYELFCRIDVTDTASGMPEPVSVIKVHKPFLLFFFLLIFDFGLLLNVLTSNITGKISLLLLSVYVAFDYKLSVGIFYCYYTNVVIFCHFTF